MIAGRHRGRAWYVVEKCILRFLARENSEPDHASPTIFRSLRLNITGRIFYPIKMPSSP
jgi:hypothetical protein